MHISYESGILEDPSKEPPEDLYLMTKDPKSAPDQPVRIEVQFQHGVPIMVKSDTEFIDNPLDIFLFLNKIGGQHGVGRIDIVENRFLGLKVGITCKLNIKIFTNKNIYFQSRGVYETPAGFILHVAHTDLEVFCLDKEVYRVKQSLRDRLSDYVYNGFWFSPEGQYVRKCIALAEEWVTGVVKLEIYKGNGE